MIRITTSIKPKGRKQYASCFSQHQILKTQERIIHEEQCYQINQFILASANSYRNFHMLFIYCVLYFPLCTFSLYFPCLALLLLFFFFFWIALESRCCQSSDFSLFHKSPTIGQLNVQAVTAENEEQYTLSTTIYIAFQICCYFFKVFLEKAVLKRYTN